MPRLPDKNGKRLLSSPEEGGEKGAGDSHAPSHRDRGGSVGMTGDGIAGGDSGKLKKSDVADDSSESGEIELDVHPAVPDATAVVTQCPAPERAADGHAAVESAAPELKPPPAEAVLLDGCAATSVEESEDVNAGPEDEKPALVDSSQVSLPDARGGPPGGMEAESTENAKGPAADVAGDKLYTVHQPLNLGLSLKLGSSYTAADMRRRCRGNKKKLSALDGFLADPAVLSEASVALSEVDAKGSKARRGRSSKKKDACGSVPPSKKSKPDTVPLTLAKAAPKRRKAAGPPDLSAKLSKAAALPLSRIGSQILATAIGDPSAPAILRPESRKSDAFVVGQTVWYLDASRPPWPAQIVAVPVDSGSPAYRVRPLGEVRPEQQIGDGIDAHPGMLLTFVRGDALALALVADQAEMLHERFADGQAEDAEDRSTPTESSGLAGEKASQSAERMMDSSSSDDAPATVCDAPAAEGSLTS